MTLEEKILHRLFNGKPFKDKFEQAKEITIIYEEHFDRDGVFLELLTEKLAKYSKDFNVEKENILINFDDEFGGVDVYEKKGALINYIETDNI